MSPEQSKGKAVDKRTDIWAFGCILYECLTGKSAFAEETLSETLAAILRNEPDLDYLPAETPASIRALLRRCLQKNPRQRLRDIGDAWIEIEAAPRYQPDDIPRKYRFAPLWIAAGAVMLFSAGFFLDRLLTRSGQGRALNPPVRSRIEIQPGHSLDGFRRDLEGQRPTRIAMAISSNSRFIVYSAISENSGPQAKSQLFLHRLDQLEAKPIPGTEGAIHPFLSPDDRWIGFWTNGYLYKIPVEGETPATQICSAGSILGASWHNGAIVFAGSIQGGLLKVSADGGKPELLTAPDPKLEESSHRLPHWLPDGRAVLFTVMRHDWDTQPWIAVLQLDTREWRPLIQDAADARYVSTGHLVFLRQGTLMAVSFDLNKLQTTGQPFSVVKDVVQAMEGFNSNYNSGAGQWDVSKEGDLVYAAGAAIPSQERSLVWVDQQGNEQLAVPFKFPFHAPRLSPDGKRIAYATAGKDWQVWVYDLDAETNARLTTEGRAVFPIWAPDGKRLAFSWAKSLAGRLFVQAFDGSSPMERLTTSDNSDFPGSWSRDGNYIALAEEVPDNSSDIVIFEGRTRRVSPFLKSNYAETYPEFSPDGLWIAYCSDESKRDEVYVRPFPGPGGKLQISSNGGTQPLWSKNGKQLFYTWQNQMWVVDLQTGGGLSASNRRMLFEKPGYNVVRPVRSYDLSLDGRRFLMVKLDQKKPTPVTELVLVQNWFEELKRLVPTGKN